MHYSKLFDFPLFGNLLELYPSRMQSMWQAGKGLTKF